MATNKHATGRNTARWRPATSRANVMLTPRYVLDPIRRSMGGRIGLDPCTEADNPTGAERFYALPTNGLAEPWDADGIYVNPPYGDASRPWAVRALEVGQARGRVALLLPATTDTDLGQSLLQGADAVVFLWGRVRFDAQRAGHPDKPWTLSGPSVLYTWNLDTEPLRELGVILRSAGIVGLLL